MPMKSWHSCLGGNIRNVGRVLSQQPGLLYVSQKLVLFTWRGLSRAGGHSDPVCNPNSLFCLAPGTGSLEC